MNEKRRIKQIDFLDRMDSLESLGRVSEYWIVLPNRKIADICQCAGTAIMLLNTKYKNTDVFVRKIA